MSAFCCLKIEASTKPRACSNTVLRVGAQVQITQPWCLEGMTPSLDCCHSVSLGSSAAGCAFTLIRLVGLRCPEAFPCLPRLPSSLDESPWLLLLLFFFLSPHHLCANDLGIFFLRQEKMKGPPEFVCLEEVRLIIKQITGSKDQKKNALDQ